MPDVSLILIQLNVADVGTIIWQYDGFNKGILYIRIQI